MIVSSNTTSFRFASSNVEPDNTVFLKIAPCNSAFWKLTLSNTAFVKSVPENFITKIAKLLQTETFESIKYEMLNYL